jgi:hypothetical protein
MASAPLPPLQAQHLRTLDVDGAAHPRGQPHLSAASGLVCTLGRAYVVADDEHHLAVFSDLCSRGRLHRIAAGDLPHDAVVRKRRKRDFESLFLLPGDARVRRLVALGSGSRANRCAGVVIELDARGWPRRAVRSFDLAPLFEPLAARCGALNIEGAFVQRDRFVLINRAADDNAGNLALHYPLRALHEAIAGSHSAIAPEAMHRHALGHLSGVPLGFTDAAPLPGGGWVYSAAAEERRGSVADGPCSGSVIGIVGADGSLRAQRALDASLKIEGIAVRPRDGGLDLCLVSDADDPGLPSCLLGTRWQARQRAYHTPSVPQLV